MADYSLRHPERAYHHDLNMVLAVLHLGLVPPVYRIGHEIHQALELPGQAHDLGIVGPAGYGGRIGQ